MCTHPWLAFVHLPPQRGLPMAEPEQAWSLTSRKDRGSPPHKTNGETKKVVLRGDQLLWPTEELGTGQPRWEDTTEGKGDAVGVSEGLRRHCSEKRNRLGPWGPCRRGKGKCLTGRSSNTGRTRKAITKPTSSVKMVVSQGPVCSLRAANFEPLSWMTSQAPRGPPSSLSVVGPEKCRLAWPPEALPLCPGF